MLGIWVNVGAILLGGAIGCLLRGSIAERLRVTMMQGLGLCVLVIGIMGTIQTQDMLALIVSALVGALIGEGINIERRLETLSSKAEKRFAGKDSGSGLFAQGMMTASLVFCVGAMAVVGSMDSGLRGDHTTLFAKAALDGVAAVFFASAMGPGVLLSAVPVLLYQGAIALLSRSISPWMTEPVVLEMSAVGGMLIIGIGLNLLGIAKIRIGNMLPGIFIPMAYVPIVALLFG